jgi:hypothetical protein
MATRRKKIPIAEVRTEICRECRWADFEKDVIKCRRYPPKPVFDGSDGFVDSYIPTVSADGWCGEFCGKLSS